MTAQDRDELRRLLSLPGGEEAALETLLSLRRERAQRRQPSQHRHGSRTKDRLAELNPTPTDLQRAEARRDARRLGLAPPSKGQ